MERNKKAIIYQLEKLIKKYGFDKARLTINKYFQLKKEEESAANDIREKEKELASLKNRLKK